jgi:hypothetical protein
VALLVRISRYLLIALVSANEGNMSQAAIDTISRNWPARMRTREASEYLLQVHGVRLSPSTLAKLRVIGGSPPFQYDGRFPVFTPKGLDDYAATRLGPMCRSTTDKGQAVPS